MEDKINCEKHRKKTGVTCFKNKIPINCQKSMPKNKLQNIKKYRCVQKRSAIISSKSSYNCTMENNGSNDGSDLDYFCDEGSLENSNTEMVAAAVGVTGKQITKLLSGPISLTYHPDVFGRAFYLFGDEHTNAEGLCKSKDSELLYDYLDKVFKKTDSLTDFFVEFPSVQKGAISVRPDQGASDTLIMGKMFIKFRDCLLPNKTICKLKYPKLRLHYIDIRGVVEKNENLVTDNFLSYFLAILGDSYGGLAEITSRKDLNEDEIYETDFLLSMDPITYNRFVDQYFSQANNLRKFIEDLVANTMIPKFETNGRSWYYSNAAEFVYPEYGNKIARQLQMTIPQVSEKILHYYADKLIPLKKNYKRLWERLHRFKDDESRFNFNEVYPQLLQILFETTILQLDVFVLARIFKSTLQDSKEVWIYMGASHTEHYSEFIIDYLKIPKMIQSKNIDERCIDVSSIPFRTIA